MARHEPGVIWPTRPIGSYPQQYVRTADEDTIEVSFIGPRGPDGSAVRISRHDARMLARRLNECLDAALAKPHRTPYGPW